MKSIFVLKIGKIELITYELKKRIYTGELKSGDKIPTQNELATLYKVSRDTLNKAIKELVSDGWIKTSKKGGSLVPDSLPFEKNYALVSMRDSWEQSSFTRSLILAASEIEDDLQSRLTPFHLSKIGMSDNNLLLLDEVTQKMKFAGYIFCDHPHLFHNSVFVKNKIHPKACFTSCDLDGFFDILVWFDFKALYELIAEKMIIKNIRRPFFLCVPENNSSSSIMDVLKQKNIPHSPSHSFSLPCGDEQNTKNVIRIITQMHESVRPDAVIILDDNLLKPVCDELQSMKERGHEAPLIISHFNYPSNYKTSYPVIKIGFDLRNIFTTCIPLLEKKRLGEDIPKKLLIKPKSFS
ncbi:MAG: GntR family transcriptional regulator [Verrucomicrobiota bacterium]|nr:GntR family transcriptional regulator [Verrucomicrobiota bacterium]